LHSASFLPRSIISSLFAKTQRAREPSSTMDSTQSDADKVNPYIPHSSKPTS
jgi:hypothetical protein